MTSALRASDRSFWKGRRVLITGHTGFKGSWLALWLTELGADITGLALPPDGETNLFSKLSLANLINHNIIDVSDLDGVKELVSHCKPEIVFHLAAQPLVRLSYEEPLSTWVTNVIGTINLLEALRSSNHLCCAVMVTTDKVYKNKEWTYGYREVDELGGYDPYSSSKAAAEIAIDSWRSSYCGPQKHQTPYLRISSARAGNVIGGGDWARDRIIPDMIRAISGSSKLIVRNPRSTRPWQHVLEPLSGYLTLAESLYRSQSFARAFNFGPLLESNRDVRDLVREVFKHWPGVCSDQGEYDEEPHEAGLLNLSIEASHHHLHWSPRWNFSTTVDRTVNWYRRFYECEESALQCCLDDLNLYQASPPL